MTFCWPGWSILKDVKQNWLCEASSESCKARQEQVSSSSRCSLWGKRVSTASTSQRCFLGVCFGDVGIASPAQGSLKIRATGRGEEDDFQVPPGTGRRSTWPHRHCSEKEFVFPGWPSARFPLLFGTCAPVQCPLPHIISPYTLLIPTHCRHCLHVATVLSIPSTCQALHIGPLP